MADTTHKTISVNGRDYAWPTRPLVVICCDGSEPAYMEQAMSDGLMPNLKAMIAKGEKLRAKSVVPSFTNPNNLSIVTGRPPAVHGISGNYFFDADAGEEVLMNDPKFLRAPTIFAAFQKQGAKVVVLTAKDKLRRLLCNGLQFAAGARVDSAAVDGTVREVDGREVVGKAVGFSAERANEATMRENGIDKVLELTGMDLPEVYSAELSEFVMAAGVKLLEAMRPQLMYLSTTDYVQHKFAPGTSGSNDFYVMLDKYLGALDRLGANVVLTADHGMKAKTSADGTPDVLYLQELLDEWLAPGAARVILPITDPYVVHHGALGSFATVYLPEGADRAALIVRLQQLDGIDVVYARAEGCRIFELPEDRMGDLIVVSKDSKVIGTTPARHDLSALKEPLRSHGGITEQTVPFIINARTENLPDDLRNFDAFFVGCNHITNTGA